jgi:superfamily II DNA or RNA helicase
MDNNHPVSLPPDVPVSPAAWGTIFLTRFRQHQPDLLLTMLPALQAYPTDAGVLLLVTIAALVDERPEQSLRYLHRFNKHFDPYYAEDNLLRAIALAQQGIWTQAAQLMQKMDQATLNYSVGALPNGSALVAWINGWLRQISEHEYQRRHEEQMKAMEAARAARLALLKKPLKEKKALAPKTPPAAPPPVTTGAPPLPQYNLRIPLTLTWPENLAAQLTTTATARDRAAFRLRDEAVQLSLLQGFDDLLCLSALHGVETYWYQVESVRKVLRQFRGRVLLADEVGLGKTIEAGMVLKEYLLRGMAERVLVLTPATLVGQWQEEMLTKFDVEFATTYDSATRSDALAFWSQPRVIASIATARRPEHQQFLAQQNYDLVIVDEAHHLKNRATANWKLVNALNKRFLLLLSATPVQNSLIELYNLLTLLKPGIFKTEKEFRARYMTNGKPRVPANRDTMRDLMRDVMIRNTRSLVEVKLPPRHATTLRLEPTGEEAACYGELSRLVQEAHQTATAQQRMSLRHLLAAAGSTAATAALAIGRYADKRKVSPAWRELQERYEDLQLNSKEQALLDVLQRNVDEKKMVFVQHRETLLRLQTLAADHGLDCVVFEGSMTGPEKDRAIELFRGDVPLLLCTESGGEGRNLQFCNTLVNFDLPWNPMAIEQRIGRIHRIGQTRDVFIFNLALRGTLEERVLSILDEKINMFELVVGEIDAILGEMSEEQDFAELVFAAWVENTDAERDEAFAFLGERLAEAKKEYDAAKSLDEELFGEEFVAG